MGNIADYAEYGIRIHKPEGVPQAVNEIGKLDAAVARTSNNLTKHAGSFAASVAKHTNGASMLIRMMGGLGGEAGILAAKLERVALSTERMVARTANSASQTKILEAAFKSGAIGAATLEAAQLRLTTARSAATAAEQAYAAAVSRTREAQELSQITALAVREQRLVTSGATRAASGSGVFSAETENAARQQKLLNEVQRDAVVSSNVLREAQQAERAAKMELSAANKEAAASQKLMNEASAGTTTGFGTAAVVITGLVAGLVILAAGIYAAHKAWHLLMESIREASEQQKQAFPLQALIGNVELAKEKVEELHSFWEQSGVFKFKDLAEGAKMLTLMGTGTDHLIDRLKSLGTISVATGEDLKGQISAYERVRLSIEKGTDIQIRGMGAMGAGMITIVRALMDETGKDEAEVLRMFKEHKIGIELVDRALANATTGTGRYAHAQEGFMKTLGGAQTVFKTRWEAIKDSLGAPVRDALTPLVTAATQALEGLKPLASEIGLRIGGIVTAFGNIARETGWVTAIKAAWDVLLSELVITIQTKLRQAFTSFFLDNVVTESGANTASWLDKALSRFDAGFDEAAKTNDKPPFLEAIKKMWSSPDVTAPATTGGEESATAYSKAAVRELESAKARFKTAVDALFAPADARTITLSLDVEPARKAIEDLFKLPASMMETFGKDASKQFSDGALQQIDLSKGSIQLALQDAFKLTTLGSPSLSGTGVGPIPMRPPDTHDIKTEFMGKTGKGKESDWEKYKTDVQIINDYWADHDVIMSKVVDSTERERRIMELTEKTAGELYDPKQFEPYLGALGKVMVAEAERERRAKELDRSIRLGTASWVEAMESGINKLTKSWGNMAQKIEQGIQDIGNALANDISSGLTDIITGTVDLKTGFTNMAIAILKDIAQILIKMEVQILLQTILNALQGVGGGTSGIGTGSGIRGARGGAIYGPSHAGGGVDIEAEGGEFMLRKSAVRNQQMEDLYALNEGRATIVRKKYLEGGGVDIPPIGSSGVYPSIYNGPGYFVNPWHIDTGASVGGYHNYPPGGNYAVNEHLRNPFAPGGGRHSYFRRDQGDSGEWENQPPFFAGVYNSVRTIGGYAPNLGGAQGSFTGTPSLYPTSWTFEPGLGWVPRAQGVDHGGGSGGAGGGGFGGRGGGGGTSTGNTSLGTHFDWSSGRYVSNSFTIGSPSDSLRQASDQGLGANFWQSDERVLASSFDATTGESLVRHPGTTYRYSGNPHDPTGSFAQQNWGQFYANLSAWNAAPRHHAGGIIGMEGFGAAYMAAGGEVPIVGQRGEGVFTRGQMAAIGAGMSGGNQVTVIVHVDSHDNVTTATAESRGKNAEEGRRWGELMKRVAQKEIADSRRHGGQLHVSQTGAR